MAESEYVHNLRARVEGLPPLQKAMLDLDSVLTGHYDIEIVRQYHHYPVNLEHWIKQSPSFQFIWYLSDSGYSRVVWSEESKRLFLTDNSTSKVKANWEKAVPQRQAVEAEMLRQWNALGGENPEAQQESQHYCPDCEIKSGGQDCGVLCAAGSLNLFRKFC